MGSNWIEENAKQEIEDAASKQGSGLTRNGASGLRVPSVGLVRLALKGGVILISGMEQLAYAK